MNLLIASLHYAPEATGNAPYTTGLAEHLVSRGHSVTVLAGFPSYPMWRVASEHQGQAWKREEINGVDVRRRWHYVPPQQSLLQRGLFEGSFLVTGLSGMTLPRPDAVLGVVPSLSGGLLARLLAQRFHVPYGVIFQDLMGQSAEQSGVRGGRRAASPVRVAEGWVARGAATVGIITEGFRPYVESLGVDPIRISCLRNWTHIEAPTMDRRSVRERLDLRQDAFVCLHAGNMGHKQGLENVVECARLAAGSDSRLLFVLAGDGSRRRQLEALTARYGLPNLRFLPIQPDELFPSLLAAADVLVVNQRAGVTDMSLPSKLTSYFAVGRPVVAAVEPTSEAAREVEESGGGLAVPADEPLVLLRALQMLAGNKVLSARLGRSAQAWAATALSRTSAMERYERFLAAVLAAGDRTSSNLDYEQFLAAVLATGDRTTSNHDRDIDTMAAPAAKAHTRRGASDGEQQLLVREIGSGHRRRRLPRQARRPEAPDAGHDSTLRAA